MEKEIKTVLYQLNDYSQMMSYVIKTATGKIIVIDGGYDRNGQELLELIKQLLNVEKPEIRAWFFTHCHRDHIMAFVDLAKRSKDSFSVDRIYYNFPSDSFIQAYGDDAFETLTEFKSVMNTIGTDKYTVVQKGDQIVVDDVKFDILLTHDETITYNAINESSTVIRMSVGNQSVMFLADLGEKSGFRLHELYKELLKNDVVQMAHHGSNGVSKVIYESISPKACLWPTPDWLWNNDNGGGRNSGPWETITLYEYMKNELNVKHHYVSKDGVTELEFPIKLE